MNNRKFKGSGVALVTPFKQDGTIDFKAFKRLIERCIKGGADYLVPLGTTGETVTLTAAEKRVVMDFVVEINAGRVPVMMGLGGNNTMELLRAMDEYDFSSIDGILSVSPYYNRPSQRGIIDHYKAIAAECPVPVILYNVPSRTGSNLDVETVLELADACKNIVGVKEASGSLEKAMHLIHHRPKDFLVICGDDLLTLPMMACGADGVISVVANAYPKEIAALVASSRQGEMERARKIHYRLLEVTETIFREGNPTGIKALLSMMGVCDEYVRMPLAPATKSLHKRLEAFL